MTLSFRILPHRGLVYVRHQGFALQNDTLAAFADYARHPDCRPGQKHLVDLSGVTGYEKDFTKLMQVQARKAEVFATQGAQSLVVYFAPTRLGKEWAGLVLRSWEGFDCVVALIQDDEAQALELLGQPERSFEALLQHAGDA